MDMLLVLTVLALIGTTDLLALNQKNVLRWQILASAVHVCTRRAVPTPLSTASVVRARAIRLFADHKHLGENKSWKAIGHCVNQVLR